MTSIKEIFKKRKEFKGLNKNFDNPDLPSFYTKYYLDTWEISPYYGKVDTLGIPVVPKQSSLRYCTYGSDKEQFMVLQPMADFFFSLREQYEECYKDGTIKKNDTLFTKELLPKKAFINHNLEYPVLMQSKYRNFVDYLLKDGKINLIKNYDDFLYELTVYIKSLNTYFTRAGYVESTDYSLLHTGLALDIYKGKISDDKERIKFFKGMNGDAFLELCIRNNLKIDREIPWRLFLDIRTKSNGDKYGSSFKEKIIKFIPDFKEDLQLFFDTYYDKVVPYDDNSYIYFVEFNELLEAFYFSFVNSHPTYKTYNINQCGATDVKSLKRGLSPALTPVSKYIDLYFKFRNIELCKVVTEERLSHYTDMANLLFKSESVKETPRNATINAFKYYTNNVGTLAYRNLSSYEVDQNKKIV